MNRDATITGATPVLVHRGSAPTMSPELREAWVKRLRTMRDQAETDNPKQVPGWETAARLLELDGAGVIDLDHEPGLRIDVQARMDVASRDAWHNIIAGPPAPITPRHAAGK